MLDTTKTADVSVDGDVVRWIGEDEVCFGVFEQRVISNLIARIPAQ
jgi:hypothetical protein